MQGEIPLPQQTHATFIIPTLQRGNATRALQRPVRLGMASDRRHFISPCRGTAGSPISALERRGMRYHAGAWKR